MGSMIGIDLGTTNSVVAVLDGPQPRVLDSREGRSQTRSAVGLKLRRRTAEGAGEFQLLVGDPAFDNWPMAPRHTIVSIKRLMGRAIADPEVQRVRETWQYEIVQPSHGTEDSVRVVMGGRQYSPADVSAMVLGKLKADAELRLGAPVTHAVITVPAYFSEAQKAATREAGQKAGLSVIKLLDEPTAAAIAFGMEGAGSDETEYLLVFDLGGGTFDISVLMRAGSVFVPLNLQGDMWLGGDNFNALIVQRVVEHVRRQWSLDPTGNHRFMVSLQAAAQRAKEALSSASSTDIVLPGLLHDADGDLIDVEHTLTRAELEAMIGPSVERAMELTRVAIDKAGLGLEQIGHVLLAGNATMMPLVQREVARMFGPEKVLRRMHPKHCVALGAAIVASRIGDRVVCDGCGHVNETQTLQCSKCGALLHAAASESQEPGRELVVGSISPFYYGTLSSSGSFSVFVSKGDPVPTEQPKVQSFPIPHARQRMLSIPVYGREDESDAGHSELQGEAFAVLPPNLPQGSVLRVQIVLDEQGLFHLEAHLDDGTDLGPWITRGEEDTGAIRMLEKVEETIGAELQALGADELRELEEARNRFFSALRRKAYGQAREEAEHLQQRVAEMAGTEAATQLDQARNLLEFVDFVLRAYGWGLEAQERVRLRGQVERTREAMAEEGAELEEHVQRFEQALNELPPLVSALLGVKLAIISRVRPADPAKAAALQADQLDVEAALQADGEAAMAQLNLFIQRVEAAVAKADSQRPGGVQCRTCGAPMEPGKRFCPACGVDNWRL